jgi:hypothetical protein
MDPGVYPPNLHTVFNKFRPGILPLPSSSRMIFRLRSRITAAPSQDSNPAETSQCH